MAVKILTYSVNSVALNSVTPLQKKMGDWMFNFKGKRDRWVSVLGKKIC